VSYRGVGLLIHEALLRRSWGGFRVRAGAWRRHVRKICRCERERDVESDRGPECYNERPPELASFNLPAASGIGPINMGRRARRRRHLRAESDYPTEYRKAQNTGHAVTKTSQSHSANPMPHEPLERNRSRSAVRRHRLGSRSAMKPESLHLHLRRQ
jgi:hypothetical protein